MHPVAIIFGFACLGAIVASVRVKSRSAQVMALLLSMVWADANILWLIDGVRFLPLLDAPIAALACVTWWHGRQSWQFYAAATYSARLPLHALGEWGVIDLGTHHNAINALFLASLVAIAWKGGIADVVVAWGRIVRRAVRGMAQNPSAVIPRLTP